MVCIYHIMGAVKCHASLKNVQGVREQSLVANSAQQEV